MFQFPMVMSEEFYLRATAMEMACRTMKDDNLTTLAHSRRLNEIADHIYEYLKKHAQ